VRFRRDDGTLAPTGEIGNIEVRSPVVAGGYYKRPTYRHRFGTDGSVAAIWAISMRVAICTVRGRADEIAWINGKMVSALLLQDTLCQLSSVRYAAIVRDVNLDFWIAAVVPWPGLLIDLAQCRETIISLYGLTSVVVVRVDRGAAHAPGKVDRVAVSNSGRQFAS